MLLASTSFHTSVRQAIESRIEPRSREGPG